MSAKTLFVGIGSPYGDDRLGWLVADAIAERLPASAGKLTNAADDRGLQLLQQPQIVVRKAGSPADILDWVDEFDRLVICDACRSGGPAGQAYRWTWPDRAIEQAHCSGSHDLDLASVLELARRLHCLPPTVVWGVEAENLNPQELSSSGCLSTAVAARLDHIAEAIMRDLCSLQPD